MDKSAKCAGFAVTYLTLPAGCLTTRFIAQYVPCQVFDFEVY